MASMQTRIMASQNILANDNGSEKEKGSENGVSTPSTSTQIPSNVNPAYSAFVDFIPVTMIQHESFNFCQSHLWKEKSFNTDSSSESSSSDTLPIFSCKFSCTTTEQSPAKINEDSDLFIPETLNSSGGNVISLCKSLQGKSFRMKALSESNESLLSNVFTPIQSDGKTVQSIECPHKSPSRLLSLQPEGGHPHTSTTSQLILR